MGFSKRERESQVDRFRFRGELFRRLWLGFDRRSAFSFFEWINEKLRWSFLLLLFCKFLYLIFLFLIKFVNKIIRKWTKLSRLACHQIDSRISNQRWNQRNGEKQVDKLPTRSGDESRIPFAVVQFNYNCGSWRVRRGWLGEGCIHQPPFIFHPRNSCQPVRERKKNIRTFQSLPTDQTSFPPTPLPHWNRQKDPSPTLPLPRDARSDGGILKVARWLRKWVIKVAEERRFASGRGDKSYMTRNLVFSTAGGRGNFSSRILFLRIDGRISREVRVADTYMCRGAEYFMEARDGVKRSAGWRARRFSRGGDRR